MIREETFTIERPAGPDVRGESYDDDNPTGTVVICHGFKGFAHWAFFPHLARSIAAAGMRAITFDFSGSGIGADRKTFTEPDAFADNTFTRELADLDAVIVEARRRNWLTGSYGVLGHSRGGAVAILHVANNSDVSALVTWAAIAHVERWPPHTVDEWRLKGHIDITNTRTGQVMKLGTAVLEDVAAFKGTSLDVAAAARSISVPWLIVHGTRDETVPDSEAAQLHEHSRTTSKLRMIEGASHSFDSKHPFADASAALTTAVDDSVKFLAEHLGTGRAAH